MGFVALQELTADGLNAAIGLVARKTLDQAAPQNATVLINDSALVIATPAGKSYLFECKLRYSANVAADLKWAFAIPAGAGAGLIYSALAVPAGSAALNFVELINAQVGTAEGMTVGSVWMRGVLDSGDGGNLRLQFAQNTAHASDTKILVGSFLVLKEL